jgi:hypothetical protein
MTTIIYGDDATDVTVESGSGAQLWLQGAALTAATGWQIKPEGICRDDLCITVRDRPDLLRAGSGGPELDLAGFARLMDQPFAREESADVWSFAPSLQQRRDALRDLQAPDFTLPDLHGTAHTLAEQRGKKIALALWASW